MRFCQAQALVYSLMKDEQIKNLQEREINLITEKIIEGVLGHMLEDIVIYETKRVLMPNRHENKKQVFQIRFEAGEFDMVIYDNQTNTCEIYEIKHSLEAVPFQYRHLINEDKIELTEKRFGKITKKCVLYRGETMQSENDVMYKNVEEYLNNLADSPVQSKTGWECSCHPKDHDREDELHHLHHSCCLIITCIVQCLVHCE
jgi:hypothetical protein